MPATVEPGARHRPSFSPGSRSTWSSSTARHLMSVVARIGAGAKAVENQSVLIVACL